MIWKWTNLEKEFANDTEWYLNELFVKFTFCLRIQSIKMDSSMTQIGLNQSVAYFSGLGMFLLLRTIFSWSAKTELSGYSQSRKYPGVETSVGTYSALLQTKQIQVARFQPAGASGGQIPLPCLASSIQKIRI